VARAEEAIFRTINIRGIGRELMTRALERREARCSSAPSRKASVSSSASLHAWSGRIRASEEVRMRLKPILLVLALIALVFLVWAFWFYRPTVEYVR
jgi:hypothetical protein